MNNANAGAGSLRQAVSDANGTGDADTITFAPSVVSPITLSGGAAVITKSLTIDGPGAEGLKIVHPTDSPFFVNDTLASGIVVEIEGLSLEGHTTGSGSAGGALRAGSGQQTTIRNCVISGSSAANQGGAVFVENTLLRIIDSTISGNNAGSFGGGIYGRDAGVQVSGSTLSGNKSVIAGGAISIADPSAARPSSLEVTDSTLTGNKTTSGGGFGGGIAVTSADGPTSITRSTVSGNSTVEAGGGLYFGYASSLAIDSSTFSTNASAGRGGGIFVNAPSGPTTITDSTVAGNTSSDSGAGVFSFGYFDKPVTISNSTIASNVASGSPGGGIFRFGYDGAGPGYEGPDEITLVSTVVANNLASTGGGDLADGPLASGSFRAANSLIGATAGATVTEAAPGTNQLNSGPIPLGPLADNGGPTPTMLPPVGSPLIDAGAANGLATDQRGLARAVNLPGGPVGGDGTDIGAVELQDATLEGASLKVKRKQKVKGRKVVIAVKASADEAVTAAASGTVKVGKKKLQLSKPQARIVAGATATLKLKPGSKKSLRKIVKALAGGKKAKASLNVEFADVAGNASTLPAKVTLSAKKDKKK